MINQIKEVAKTQKMINDVLYPNWTELLGDKEIAQEIVEDEINIDKANDNRI